jgi:biopolymer transport protein ExbD
MAAFASSYDDDQDAGITDINVTPLVDIVLVLLIVFMITIPTIVAIDLSRERELKIVLPEASEAKPLSSPPPRLFVNVDSSGHYAVNGDARSLQELEGTIRQASLANPGRAVVLIRADKRCPWQYVVNVMNLCNAAKIPTYSVSAAE